jgi:hypothetical protein
MSPDVDAPSQGNRLFAALSRKDRASVLAACELVDLEFESTICEPDSPIRHVYFPTTSYISLITPKHGVESLEVGLVGNEGAFGITLILGVDVSLLKGLVQGEGRALRMRAKDFRRAYDTGTSFARVMNAYMYVQVGQIAQSAACGRFHLLEARLARWILMTHDRANADTFKITHTFLGRMLGVRRPGVTEAAGQLQEEKLLRYRHGEMQVLNRAGLERRACQCYEIFNQLYTKNLPAKK